MVLALIASLFNRQPKFHWQPSIKILDGATAAALGIYDRS